MVAMEKERADMCMSRRRRRERRYRARISKAF